MEGESNALTVNTIGVWEHTADMCASRLANCKRFYSENESTYVDTWPIKLTDVL